MRLIAGVAIVLVVALAWRGAAPASHLVQLACFAVAGGTLLALALARPSALLAGALTLLVVAEISLVPWGHLVTYSGRPLERYRRYESELVEVATRAGSDRVWVYGDLAKLQPELALKLATRYRLRVIDDYEPLHLARQAEYFTFFTEGTPEFRRPPWLFRGNISSLTSPPGVEPAASRRRLLDLTALRYIVVPAAVPGARPELRAFLASGGFELKPFMGEKLLLFENRRAVPRAYVVYRTRPAPEAAALLAAISADGFDPLVESYVEGESGLALAASAPERGSAARIVVDAERVVEIEATLERPGVVVLADSFYPGWRASVDGTPAPILATNHLFRGVPAPAGTHRVRFEYLPRSVVFGGALSMLGWSVIAGLCFLAWRKSAS
jgi:hypothetical protein